MTVPAEDIANAIRVILNRDPTDAAEIEQLAGRRATLAEITVALMRGREAQARIAERVRDADAALGDFSAERTVFMHIPKTAGTTIRKILRQNFKPNITFPDGNWLATYSTNMLANYQVFVGHYTLNAIQHIPGEKRIFTVLRDPRERVLSYYRYMRARLLARPRPGSKLTGKFDPPPEEYFADPKNRAARPIFNTQTRYLCCITPEIARKHGLNKPGAKPFRLESDLPLAAEIAKENLRNLAGFGLVEQFDDFLELVLPGLGLKLPKVVKSSNVTTDIAGADNDAPKPPPKAAPSAELQALLGDLVAADQMVYDYAKDLFKQRYLSRG